MPAPSLPDRSFLCNPLVRPRRATAAARAARDEYIRSCPLMRTLEADLADALDRLRSVRAAGKYAPRQEREILEHRLAVIAHHIGILDGSDYPDEDLEPDCPF